MTNKNMRHKSSSDFKTDIRIHEINEKESSGLLTEIAELFYDVACQFQNSSNNKQATLKLDNTDLIQTKESV